MKAIYKIENKINHKIYIGQSINPQRRWQEHCHKKGKSISLIGRAIKKYGVKNFSFKILGWFEDYNEKEKYYIQYYRSLAPNGYNIAIGGEEPPHRRGEENSFAKINSKTAFSIKKDLKNWKIPRKQIIKKYNISENILRHINEGTSWFDENENYPLRPKEREINNFRASMVIDLLITTNLSQKEIGVIIGWCASAIKEINQGRSHYDENLIYPIRNHQKENKAILNL